MSDDWETYPSKAYTYDIIFSTEQGYPDDDSKGAIVLFKRNGWSSNWDTLGEWSSTEEFTGWHHVEVTRDADGVFDVYFDEEHIIHVEDEEPESGMFTTFRFEAPSGVELDNIVVSDLTEESSGGIPGFPIMSIVFGLITISVLNYIRKK